MYRKNFNALKLVDYFTYRRFIIQKFYHYQHILFMSFVCSYTVEQLLPCRALSGLFLYMCVFTARYERNECDSS